MYTREVSEYFTAKRKAARMVGGADRVRDLPSNREIREQLLTLAQLPPGLDDLPAEGSAWDREAFQRNAVARGVQDGDALPELPCGGELSTSVILDLGLMEMGEDQHGRPSWSARTQAATRLRSS